MVLEHTGYFQAAQDAYELAVILDGDYERAALNLDRLTIMDKQPGEEPVDMAAAAQTFTATVERWAAAVKPGEQPEWIEMEKDSIVVSEAGSAVADTTGNQQVP